MVQSPERVQFLTWAEFDDFWRELEASHEQTPYTFDAYDEEVARIAFKAGRESMRRQVAAMVEHLLETRQHRSTLGANTVPLELDRVLLREIAADVDGLPRKDDN